MSLPTLRYPAPPHLGHPYSSDAARHPPPELPVPLHCGHTVGLVVIVASPQALGEVQQADQEHYPCHRCGLARILCQPDSPQPCSYHTCGGEEGMDD
jgi:hypothetical protein